MLLVKMRALGHGRTRILAEMFGLVHSMLRYYCIARPLGLYNKSFLEVSVNIHVDQHSLPMAFPKLSRRAMVIKRFATTMPSVTSLRARGCTAEHV
jgi:hypothetical protein